MGTAALALAGFFEAGTLEAGTLEEEAAALGFAPVVLPCVDILGRTRNVQLDSITMWIGSLTGGRIRRRKEKERI